MDANTNLKGKLPGRHVAEGSARSPRTIVTRKALQNAAAVVAACGGSAHAAVRLPAIVRECGIPSDLFDGEVFKRTPYIADLKPAGRFVAKDLFEAGRVPQLMKTLSDNGFMHGDCMTVTGYSMAENLKRVAWNSERDVVPPAAADRCSLEVQSSELNLRNAGRRGNRGGRRLGLDLWKYAQQVGAARHGAVTHPGRAAEKACHADI